MKVRATQDGTYGGYYRHGPIITENGTIPGEVFEIDGEIHEVRDDNGNVIMEPVVNSNGQPAIEVVMKPAVDDLGRPVSGPDKKPLLLPVEMPKMKARTFSWFSPAWMEKVSEMDETTYDLPTFEIPVQYRVAKPRKVPVKMTNVPQGPIQQSPLEPVI